MGQDRPGIAQRRVRPLAGCLTGLPPKDMVELSVIPPEPYLVEGNVQGQNARQLVTRDPVRTSLAERDRHEVPAFWKVGADDPNDSDTCVVNCLFGAHQNGCGGETGGCQAIGVNVVAVLPLDEPGIVLFAYTNAVDWHYISSLRSAVKWWLRTYQRAPTTRGGLAPTTRVPQKCDPVNPPAGGYDRVALLWFSRVRR